MSNLSDRVVKSVGRHFVTLSCVQHPPASTDLRVHVFSGFVLEIAEEWFYVTAGHIIKDIRTALGTGSTFDIWRLGDQTAGNRFGNTAIPYAFELDQWCVLENEMLGLDYAAVHLGGLYRQQLEAGGVLPFAPDSWSDHVTEHDQWALVGIPRESVSYDGRTLITARVVLAPLFPAEPPNLADDRSDNQFYAQLLNGPDEFFKDVDGMSGGPIITLRQVDGIWKYSVIGVQSAWYRALRIIAACPLKSFAEALAPIVKEALTKAKSTQV